MANDSSSRWWETKRTPSFRSRPKCASALGVMTSTMRRPRKISTLTSNSSASATRASGAPTSLIKTPATPGPATSAPEEASAFFAWASTSRSRATTCVNTICAAVPAVTNTQPITKPTMYIKWMVNTSSAQHTGMLIRQAASRVSPHTYTGSFRTRSSHTPQGSENRTKGRISMAVSVPICVGVACSNTAAVSGRASKVIWPPKELMRIDVQRRR